ncbi:glutathione S-transferase [Gammaproteobacteria bacterium 45_16_T64]|nr:glutathione S-transferase [Gammaproteobacteria bacterium 45_16_T64]
MVTLHHLQNSRSQRILWMLEELNVPYDIALYKRDTKTDLAPASLKKVHPLGKSPVITDGDITVAESGAIVEYLGQTYGEGFQPPRGTAESREYSYWMHFSEGSLMQQLLIQLIFDKVKAAPLPFFIKPIAKGIAKKVMDGYVGPNIKASVEYIDKHLSINEWFCGDQMTGADIQMSFPLEGLVAKQDMAAYPNIVNYVKKFQARPAYQKALEAGGEYHYA